MPLQLYEDPVILHLQLKIKMLAQEMAELQGVKQGIEQQIEALQTRHHRELRALVVELLQLRQKHRRHEQAETTAPDAAPEPPTEEADKRALPEPLAKLSSALHRQLKEMFRQASKLCHPDLVADPFKAEAGVIFIELKTAYEQQDLSRVEEILRMLERGEKLTGQSPLPRNKDKLRAEVHYLRRRIESLRQEIETLKQSSTYRKLTNIEDWDDYFDELKSELQRKINRLRRRRVSNL